MTQTPIPEATDSPSDDLQAEYNFDYQRTRPNRFASRLTNERRMVVLDPDVAEVFTSAEAVNSVLRALIATMPTLASEKQP